MQLGSMHEDSGNYAMNDDVVMSMGGDFSCGNSVTSSVRLSSQKQMTGKMRGRDKADRATVEQVGFSGVHLGV